MDTTAAPLQSWQKLCLQLTKLGFTVLMAWLLALLCWRIIVPEPLFLAAPSQANTSQANQQQNLNTAQYHLFGELGAEPAVEVSEEVDAPDTRLRLVLLGATKASRNNASTAIIAPQGQEGSFYRINDVIQGSTKLAAVYENRVILDTNGKLETLKFEEESRAGVSARAVPVTPAATTKNTNSRGGLRGRFRQVRDPAGFMNVITEEASADPEGTLRQLGVETVGNGAGYRVQPGSMLMALQLQPGDVILSVNGQNLGDPAADQELLEQVNSEGQARIEVQRGNSRFVINHSLR